MRRALLLGLLAGLLLAGCGSSSNGSGSPATTELSYFPPGSPFVMSVATDPSSSAVKNAQALVSRFPIATFGESALTTKLQQVGINYDADVKPLLGDPVMVGATTPTLSGGGAGGSYLVVWMTKDAGKLSALVKKLPGAHSVGSHDGATLYQTGGPTTLAVEGATVVLGPTEGAVDAALDRHAHGGGFAAGDYNREVGGLPQGALIQAFGNLQATLSQPSAAKARQVPWVAAIRGYGATISASSAGLRFDYQLDTSGRPLTASQLPIAAGTTAPRLAGSLPITVGLQDPAQVAAFAEAVEQTTSPGKYAAFLRRQAAARKKTGADLNSLLRLLTGTLAIESDTHTTIGRASVSSPAAAARTLAKLMSAPRTVFQQAKSARRLGGGFWAIREGRQTITVGVADGQLVAGKASVGQLRSFAAAPATAVAGAQGALAFRVGLAQLLQLTIKHAPPKIVQTVLSSLGDITGWAAAVPSAVTGSASLALR